MLYIVTVTYNNADGLDATALSVFAAVNALYKSSNPQAHHIIHWIIIDGGSDDKTLQTITQIEERIKRDNLDNLLHLTWISQPDNGIYDAMNKGLAQLRRIENMRASSHISSYGPSYLLFLNAGDCLAAGAGILPAAPMISDIITQYHPAMICGDTLDLTPDKTGPYYKPARLNKAGRPSMTWHAPAYDDRQNNRQNVSAMMGLYPAENIHRQLCYGMFTRHQSMYYNIDYVMANLDYHTDYDIAGDYHFTLDFLKKTMGPRTPEPQGGKNPEPQGGKNKAPGQPWPKHQAHILYVSWALSLFAPGGVSQRQTWRGWRQERHCRQVHFPQHKSGPYHMRIIRNTSRFWRHFFIESRQLITNTLRHISPKLYHMLHRRLR